jgi:DNA-binding HxlR family transcriptional regulator
MKSITDKKVQNKIRYIQDTLYVIGGKWKLPIAIAIYYGNNRFTDLKKNVPKITARVLSKELKELEANGLIKRTVHNTYPATVEYSLEPYCRTLDPLIKEMTRWGEQHKNKIAGKQTALL